MSVDPETHLQIRVLIVDDSAFMRTALAGMIDSEPDLQVVSTARCASDAFEKISSLDPDVITLDVDMPGLDGLETLRYIMQRFPRPVIMVSAATEKVRKRHSTHSVPALSITSRNICHALRSTSHTSAPISSPRFVLPPTRAATS